MSTRGDSHIFPNATNTVITGGTFTSITNPTNSGFQLLLQNVSQGAFHNAAERGDPPRCLARTRVAIRADIMEWLKAPPAMRKLILWVYGPAGSGKTAIAQSIAEECERLRLLGASFFFWRSAGGRNNTSRFVPTLAYSLSRHIPQMKDHLIAAIEEDPLIFSRSLETQIRVLVIEPLKLAAPSLPLPIVSIVDGVDECGPNGQSQSELLHLLGSIALELQHLPLMFLVTSRPEYAIREAFNGNRLSLLAKVLVLDNSYKPDKDIKRYFKSTFRDIRKKNRRMGCRLPSPWPNKGDIDFLVSKASGQFIFASTVAKFVDSPHHNPADRLNIILRLSYAENETPFAPLDALYRFILGSVANVDQVLEVLTALLLPVKDPGHFSEDLDMDILDDLLGFDIRRSLIDMHSLVSIPSPTEDGWPEIYHASLSDFLMDRSRSFKYHIVESQGHAKLCWKWLRLLGPHDQSQRPHLYHSQVGPVDAVIYHAGMLDSPAYQVGDELSCFDLRAALESISDLEYSLYWPQWSDFMECVKKQGGGREDIFPRLQKELDAFILDCLDQYPPSLRLYLPALIAELPGLWGILDILLLDASKSAKEWNELKKLDRGLLDISNAYEESNSAYPYLAKLFLDAARAGQHFVDAGTYAALAKPIVNVICARPGENNYKIIYGYANSLILEPSDGTKQVVIEVTLRYLADSWFKDILNNASVDLELAHLLRERAVQFRNDVEPMPVRREIAQASIEYIKKCGIPFLEHMHQPHMNECAICTYCDDAIVIEGTVDVKNGTPSSPSILNSSAKGDESHSIILELLSPDSESVAHGESAHPICHEAVVTPIHSSLHLPSISEWYDFNLTTSPQQSTSHVPLHLESDTYKLTTVVPFVHHEVLGPQVLSLSSHLPSILEWYQPLDAISPPKLKQQCMDTPASPIQAYLTKRSETGK